jgi:glycosyltransferase involved in cell wall biosynthesis
VTEGCPDLREIATPGAILARAQDALVAPHARSTERLSVVICSAGRPTALGRCLASLARSSEPPDEIVVVDNAPETGATREVVARWSGVRYVAEARRGLSIARNTGLRSSAGELVAFTDDDAEVHPAWAARVRRGFADPELLALTGLVLPAVLATEAQLVFEHDFGGFGQGYRVLDFDETFFRTLRWKGAPVWLMGAGANMAFRRRAFEQVGEFDERLGAGAAGCSEDSELWYRLLTAGHSARYDPTLVVFHHHRDDWDALRAQMHAYMRGHVAALLIQHQRHGHSGNLLRLAAILPRFYASLLLSRLLHGSSPRLGLVPVEIAGCLAGLVYFLRRRSNGPLTAAAT